MVGTRPAWLDKIIKRILNLLTRTGHLIEEAGEAHFASTDADNTLAPLQAVSATWRIAHGPRAGQKVQRINAMGTGIELLPLVHEELQAMRLTG